MSTSLFSDRSLGQITDIYLGSNLIIVLRERNNGSQIRPIAEILHPPTHRPLSIREDAGQV